MSALLLYRKKISDLKTVQSTQSFGALQRSSNSYTELIVEPCVSKNEKSIVKGVLKKGWGNEKKHPRAEKGIRIFLCVKEIKLTALKLL